MPTQEWSDEIYLTDLEPDPALSDELVSLDSRLNSDKRHVILDMTRVDHIASSNISALLRLRQSLLDHDRRLILAGCTPGVMSVMKSTGLTQVFEFVGDRVTALATLQLD